MSPAAVPAGVYGRAWLERQGAWRRLESKVIPFPTVTAVLSAVANGRVDGAIVYRTDAMNSRTCASSRASRRSEHPYLDISYPAAVIAGPAKPRQGNFSNS